MFESGHFACEQYHANKTDRDLHRKCRAVDEMRREFLQVLHRLVVHALHRQHEALGQRNVPGGDAHLAALRGDGVQREHGFFALGEIRALVRGKIVQEGRGQDVRGVEAVEDDLHCYQFLGNEYSK